MNGISLAIRLKRISAFLEGVIAIDFAWCKPIRINVESTDVNNLVGLGCG
jgi:hypothetical protein